MGKNVMLESVFLEHRKVCVSLIGEVGVIPVIINEGFGLCLDIGEVYHKIIPIQIFGFVSEHGDGIMSVKIKTFALMVDEPMGITELDFNVDLIHLAPHNFLGHQFEPID